MVPQTLLEVREMGGYCLLWAISRQEWFILMVLETENKMWVNKQKNMKHFKNYILGFLKIPWEKKPWNKTRTTVSCKLIFRQEYSLGLAGVLLQAGMRMCYIFGDKILQWLVAGRRHRLRDTQQASKEGRGSLSYVLPTVALRWLGGFVWAVPLTKAHLSSKTVDNVFAS